MARHKGVQFNAVIERQKGMHVVVVPGRVAKQFTPRKAVRVFCALEDKIEYACAIRPDGDGGFYINVATTKLRQAKLKPGQKVSVTVRKDETKYGHKEPKELKELLAMDEAGRKYWEKMTNSQQRVCIYYVNQAKSVDKRIERCLLFINRLKDTKGAWPGKSQ